MNMKKCILYCRVSTDEQAASGYSLPAQMEACRKYAESLGYSVVGNRWYDLDKKKQVSAPNENTFPVPVYADDFTGTVPIEQRPEGKLAFAVLRNNLAEAMFAFRMDRLARPPEDGDEWDMAILIRGLGKLGKTLYTVQRGKLGTDFASLLIAVLDARGSGEERRKILENTKTGKDQKAKSNKVVGGGLTPYGYTYFEDRLIIREDEARIVRMIYQWYIEGHLSLYAISAKLSEMGLPTPYEKRGGKITHPGIWSPSAVHRIIKSETYIGKLHYGKRVGKNGNGGHRDRNDIIVVDVPAIVSEDVWKAAQRLVDYNTIIAKRNRKTHYLLSGLVRCGCGRAMHAQIIKGRYYYRCSEHSVGHAGIKFRQCHEHMFDGNRLEELIWNYVYNLLHGDFEADLLAAQEAEKQRHQPIIAEMDVVRQMLAEIDREAESVAKAFSKASGIVADKLQQEMELINKRHVDLSAKLAGMQADLDLAPLSKRQIEQLREFRQRVLRGIDRATQEDRRKYYEILQIQATVKDGKVQISCVIESFTSGEGG